MSVQFVFHDSSGQTVLPVDFVSNGDQLQLWTFMRQNIYSQNVYRWQKIEFVGPEKKDNDTYADFFSEVMCIDAVCEIHKDIMYFKNKNKTAKCTIHLFLRDMTFLSKDARPAATHAAGTYTTPGNDDMRQLLQQLRTILNTFDHTHARFKQR